MTWHPDKLLDGYSLYRCSFAGVVFSVIALSHAQAVRAIANGCKLEEVK